MNCDQGLKIQSWITLSFFDVQLFFRDRFSELVNDCVKNEILRDEAYVLRYPVAVQDEIRAGWDAAVAARRDLARVAVSVHRHLDGGCDAQAKECKCGTKFNGACAAAAAAAAAAAIKKAAEKFKAAITFAAAFYSKLKEALKKFYQKMLKRELLACALACVIFPPSCAGCAARVAIKVGGLLAAKMYALKKVYDGMVKDAEKARKAAEDIAKCGLKKAYASVSSILLCSCRCLLLLVCLFSERPCVRCKSNPFLWHERFRPADGTQRRISPSPKPMILPLCSLFLVFFSRNV